MALKRKRTPSSSSETEMDPKRERTLSSQTTTYQVFLSFRGPDTRQGFTDTLYHSLTDAGIRIFRDNEEIRKGEYIGDEILRAIGESRIFVPIFSRGYASSKWCLMELSKMFESMEASPGSNKKILPIFYDVCVDDVKLKTQLYDEALQKHKKDFGEDRVKPWREALKEVGKIKGWELKDMGYGKFIKLFVTEVSTKLKVKHKYLTDCLVQRDDQVEALMNMLDTEASDVRFVGIHGLGGIGKTTLAKMVFNKLCDGYDHCSFLDDVRESSQQKGIERLQKQLLRDLGLKIGDIVDGIMELSRQLRQKKVLIVLDDVDHRKQIQNLAKDASWFGKGSRIIITTRNKEVLGGIPPFELIEMNDEEALQLFSKNAFGMDYPPNDYLIDLSKKAIENTGRLPLALEVLGSELRHTDHKKWEKTIQRLDNIPQKEVQEMLMVSYESLDHGAQQIFLDIACFFIDHERTIPMYLWEACEFDAKTGLKELIHKSFVKIVAEKVKYSIGTVKVKKLWMHDQLRDLGRNIAKRSRIWMREDALKLLHKEEGKVNVEMLRLCNNNGCYSALRERDTVSREEFSGLDKLRYIECMGAKISGDLRGLLPNLRWLSWKYCPKEFVGTGLSFKKLVILDLSYSNITEDWTGWSKIGEANNLKVLDLTYCENLRKTPDLSKCLSLERLILEDCHNIVEIDPSIGKLKCLKFLNVNECISLKGFPDELCSLECLEVILGHNDYLHSGIDRPEAEIFSFLESIGNLTSLLTLGFCLYRITRLLESIIRLSRLRHLSLIGIVELPQRIGLLEKLKMLELIDCEYMEKLPDSVGDMKSLVELHLPNSGITELPETIGNLEELRVIDLSDSKINKLPNSIGKLKSLEELIAFSCDSLTEIPSTINGCTSLRILNLDSCKSMKELPDSIGCAQWRELDLTSRENMKELPVSECFLRSLRGLYLSYLGITKLPDTIGSLKDLNILSVDCTEIRSLPTNIGMLKNLKELRARACDLLEEIPSTIVGCTRLRELDLRDCENIKELLVPKCFLTSLVTLRLPDNLNMHFKSMGFTQSRSKLKVKHKFVTDYYLVQRDDEVEALMKMLDIKASDVRFVGIHGMGGIGKTTLAKTIFNKIRDGYEQCSFLANVQESSQQHKGIEHLQKQLLSDLCFKSRDIMHVDDGIMELSQKYRLKKILIILDNVDDRKQIQNLAGDASWFGKGSRIIITTRNREVLGRGVWTFELIEMNAEEALQLFSKHAFGKDFPPNDFVNLSKEVVKITGRLPLALEVIGSQLRQTPHTMWAKTIERLMKTPHKDVQEMLMISYDSLSHEAQQIFLDIACFFINHERTNPMYMWEACKFNAKMGLKELIQKSLVKTVVEEIEGRSGIVKVKKFWMHDQLRDLGRSIGKGSRIWVSEDASQVLREEKGKVNVEMLRLSNNNDYYYNSKERGATSREEFSGLNKLRYLECIEVNISGDLRGLLPNLRWLSWERCPVEFTVTDLSFRKLVILDLTSSKITEDWTGWSKIGEANNNLKVLDLSGCTNLRKTPDLSKYSCLERLILQKCYGLVEIDRSIGKLKGLKFLNVNYCTSLKGLPDGICSLDRLEVISGHNTFPYPPQVGFSNFVESIGNLRSLLTLQFCRCKITRLPKSILRLSGLRHLSLCGIVELPQGVGLLEKLQILELFDCEYMKKLPESIGDMTSLVELRLPCSGITELPETIGNLEELRVIDLSQSKIHKFPISIGKLKSLEKLITRSCVSLTKIPSTINGCTSLRILHLGSCKRMKKLPDSIGCTQWRELELLGQENIKELPVSKYFLRLLCELHLSYSRIIELPDTIGSLKDLSILSVNCTQIRTLLASIGMLKNLEMLSVENCLSLEEIPSTIGECSQLRKLDLTGCKNIKELPISEYCLRSLHELQLSDTGITELPDTIGSLEVLRKLLVNHTKIRSLPTSIGMLKNLQELSAIYCALLEKIPSTIEGCNQLRALYLIGCENIKELPVSECFLRSMVTLHLPDHLYLDNSGIIRSRSKLKIFGVEIDIPKRPF